MQNNSDRKHSCSWLLNP